MSLLGRAVYMLRPLRRQNLLPVWQLRRGIVQLRPQSTATVPDQLLSVAIAGSGPAGFYTARKLMQEVPQCEIHMYEQLPVPFGLVRFGVAPDHPEVKNCQDTFTEVAEDRRFHFHGNVNLGYELPLQTLAQQHDALVFAYGASKDRKLGLDGEDEISNIYSARAFVGWYNGLPEYRHLAPDLGAGEDAVIIGQGNVALDVARTLLTDVDRLKKTDITSWALERLAESRIKNVRIVGRRGPVQAAFTIKEVRELMQLPNTHFRPIPSDLFPADLKSLPRPQKRILELLKKGSASGSEARKSWSLDFLLSPVALQSASASSAISHTWPKKGLTRVDFVRNRLAEPFSPTSALLPSSEQASEVSMATSTLFRSIGYASEPLPGFAELGIPFDRRKGVIANDGMGRILSMRNEDEPVNALPGLYCAGWVKRGPTGVIASTMADAFATAEAIIADWKAGLPFLEGHEQKSSYTPRISTPEEINWQQWRTIDRVERSRGEQQGREREKLGTVKEMLATARP